MISTSVLMGEADGVSAGVVMGGPRGSMGVAYVVCDRVCRCTVSRYRGAHGSATKAPGRAGVSRAVDAQPD
ncbi:hypothetical protein PCAR4_200168 [Paraburkholderia caribensis]|nr:hypothetical protein PCAR4_200168 [Paraburkholderia caribensis]